MSTRFSRAYLLTQVLTANHREVLICLYDGALDCVSRAARELERGDRAACARSLERATTIVVELSCCLDFNRDGALAARLDSIYNYLIEALAIGSRTLDPAALETCQSVLTILGDAWRQALESERRSTVVASASRPSLSV